MEFPTFSAIDPGPIVFRMRHDCSRVTIDPRVLILPPVHLRPRRPQRFDERDTELECWADDDTILED